MYGRGILTHICTYIYTDIYDVSTYPRYKGILLLLCVSYTQRQQYVFGLMCRKWHERYFNVLISSHEGQ